MSRPSPILAALFRAPRWLYRHRLGWVLGRRLLAVTHVGRVSGREWDTVLEVIRYDQAREESFVVSAYGPTADWYANLLATPALRVRTGRAEYVPEQRFLGDDEAREVVAEFCRRHPWEAKVVPRVFAAIGAGSPDPDVDRVDFLASLPIVAFRPSGN